MRGDQRGGERNLGRSSLYPVRGSDSRDKGKCTSDPGHKDGTNDMT